MQDFEIEDLKQNLNSILPNNYLEYKICSNYDFPERKNRKREIILTMNKMGKNNSEIYDAIIKEFGPSDRRHTLCQITDTIRRYNRS